MNVRAVQTGLLALLFNCACGIMSKGDALPIRYFTPMARAAPAPARSAPERARELGLGSVRAAAHLEERMAYRPSDAELGYLDDQRWTEPPEEFLRRALDGALFESGRFVRVYTDAAFTLELELVSFEELRYGSPRVRVMLAAVLRDRERAVFEHKLLVEKPLTQATDDRSPAVARALANALDDAVAELTLRLSAEVERNSLNAGPGRARPRACSEPALPPQTSDTLTAPSVPDSPHQ